MTNGNRLRELRLAAGFSQKEIAKQVGVSRNAVSQWEAGQTQPSTKRLRLLGKILNTPIDRMMAPTIDVRATIIEKATRLISDLGFDDLTIDLLCEAAEISSQEFEAQFEGMDQLLYELAKDIRRRSLDNLRRTPPVYGNLSTRLKYLLRYLYTDDVAHVEIVKALMSYSWRWSKSLQHKFERDQLELRHAIVSIFDQAAAQGEIAAGNYRAASDLVYLVYEGGLRKAVYEGYDPDHLIKDLEPTLAIVLSGLGFQVRPGFFDAPH